MSQWTHVNAAIRFDTFLGRGVPTKELLGQMCRWEDEDTSHWENSILPCGSEGSIEYKIIVTGSEDSVANTVVIFTGDLRSYDDVEGILKYFTMITDGKMIRSGILEIYVEGKEALVYRYTDDNKWLLLNK